ncbi:unnamed protein product [Prunus brigantina]
MNAMSAQFSSSPHHEVWIADSGATNHMTADISNLSAPTPYSNSDAITAANGEGLAIAHIGVSTLSTRNHTFRLNSVLHVPQLSTGLLSVNQLCKENQCRCIFDATCLYIRDTVTGNILYKGLSSNGLYPMPRPLNVGASSTAFLGKKVTSDLWHCRLGHPTNSVVQLALDHSGLSTTSTASDVCEACLKGKFTKFPFPLVPTKSEKPFQIIHIDECTRGEYIGSQFQQLPYQPLHMKAPFEVLFGSSPSLAHLKIFGCACYPLMKPYNHTKLQPKTTQCIFLGYASQDKGYICINSQANKLIVSRHVLFDESLFPSRHSKDTVVSRAPISLSTPCYPLSTPPYFSHVPSVDSIVSVSSSDSSSSAPLPTISELSNSNNVSDVAEASVSGAPTSQTDDLHYILPLAPQNHHPMKIRSKSGIFKHKALLTTNTALNVVSEPHTFASAVKKNPDGSVARYKARLVAKGFSQEAGLDYSETFSPVVKPSTVRLVLALSATFGWQLQQLDVKNAFLPGILHEEVYMSQPPGFIDSENPSLVYDIIITGSHSTVIQMVIDQLSKEFDMKHLGALHYFLGLQIQYPSDDPAHYRSIVGALQYLTFTRPDIAYVVHQVCQFMHSPLDTYYLAVKRILRYLKGTIDHGLLYKKGSLDMTAYTDAYWAGDPNDRRSTTGFVVFLGSNPVSWSSKKQQSVSRSSTEAEYRAMAVTAAEVVWLQQLLSDLHCPLLRKLILCCDN